MCWPIISSGRERGTKPTTVFVNRSLRPVLVVTRTVHLIHLVSQATEVVALPVAHATSTGTPLLEKPML